MTYHDIQVRLDALLRQAGCQEFSAREALADAAECWRGIRQDAIAHGEPADKPFFSFVLVEGVGVFTFYGAAVEIYVVRGGKWDLRRRFDSLAMVDVKRARALLASGFNRPVPDLVVDEPSSTAWLSASDGGSVGG